MQRYMRQAVLGLLAAGAALAAWAAPAQGAVAMRLRDIARLREVRPNQLHGVGLVVGLNGTGDGETLASQLVKSMLEKKHMKLSAGELSSDNVAAVVVTAEIPSSYAEGSRLDVVVSCLGKAESLDGGTLLQTPLEGADGIVYAVAQGPLISSGFAAAGEAATVTKNHPTVARLPGGAIVEREIPTIFRPSENLRLALKAPDFTTAQRIADAVNTLYANSAKPLGEGMVEVAPPARFRTVEGVVQFWAQIGELRVIPATPARVVVNARTGTIVIGEDVRLSAAAVTHGNLTISIKESTKTSQPNAMAQGDTRSEKSTEIQATEDKSKVFVIEDATTLADVAHALNILGVSPRDLISILQALEQAGALQCQLVII